MVKKIIVAQLGARHRYAIPQALEEKGLLYRLYTDSTRFSFLGKMSFLLKKLGLKAAEIERLTRRVPKIPRKKLYTSDYSILNRLRNKILKPKTTEKVLHIFYNGMSSVFKHWGVGDADCVYSMHYESVDFLKFAKSKGLKIVVDIFVAPSLYEGMQEEWNKNFPQEFAFDYIEELKVKGKVCDEYMEEILGLADYYTAPSHFVIHSLEKYKNFIPDKVLYLPYPSSIVPSDYNRNPVTHRLIWVGNDPVRKGIVYCAKAADILKEKYPDLDFRIIGGGTDMFKGLPEFQNLHFIGKLNKEDLINEFQTAEAYVFPTLYEGFAGTVIEAASCGCPIITTEAAGTDVDNFPAIYIPTQNVEAIVDAVEKIFSNSEFRDKLSRQTYDYAKTLSPEVYKENIRKYFENI